MGRGGYASLAGAAPINSFGQDFLGGAAVGEKMRQVVGDIQINDRLKQIGDAVTQAGGSIDGIDPTLFSDPVGLRALGEYTTQYTGRRPRCKFQNHIRQSCVCSRQQPMHRRLSHRVDPPYAGFEARTNSLSSIRRSITLRRNAMKRCTPDDSPEVTGQSFTSPEERERTLRRACQRSETVQPTCLPVFSGDDAPERGLPERSEQMAVRQRR